MHTWWTYADKFPHSTAKISTVLSLLLGTQPKHTHVAVFDRKCCGLCEENYEENAEHIWFKCRCLIEKRSALFPVLTASMPKAMADEFNAYENNVHNVTSLMLYGLRGSYVPEWTNVYAAVITYINAMYAERNILYEKKA